MLKENAPVTVVAPALAGAQAAADQLKTYGYNVTGGLASTAPITAPVLVDLSKGKDPYTLHYLEEHYGIKAAVTSLPDGVTVPQDSAKFVIILSK